MKKSKIDWSATHFCFQVRFGSTRASSTLLKIRKSFWELGNGPKEPPSEENSRKTRGENFVKSSGPTRYRSGYLFHAKETCYHLHHRPAIFRKPKTHFTRPRPFLRRCKPFFPSYPSIGLFLSFSYPTQPGCSQNTRHALAGLATTCQLWVSISPPYGPFPLV